MCSIVSYVVEKILYMVLASPGRGEKKVSYVDQEPIVPLGS